MKDIFYQIASTNNLVSNLSKDSAIFFIKEINPKIEIYLKSNEKLHGIQNGWVAEKLNKALNSMFMFDFEKIEETTFFNIVNFDEFRINWFLLLLDFYTFLTTIKETSTELLTIMNQYFDKSILYLRKNYSKKQIEEKFNLSLEYDMPYTKLKFKDFISLETINYIKYY
jgi:hypothetical protein